MIQKFEENLSEGGSSERRANLGSPWRGARGSAAVPSSSRQ